VVFEKLWRGDESRQTAWGSSTNAQKGFGLGVNLNSSGWYGRLGGGGRLGGSRLGSGLGGIGVTGAPAPSSSNSTGVDGYESDTKPQRTAGVEELKASIDELSHKLDILLSQRDR
jgi:hypothetical protein